MISLPVLLEAASGSASPVRVQSVFVGFMIALAVGAGLAWVLNKAAGRQLLSEPYGAAIGIAVAFLLQIFSLGAIFMNGGASEDQLTSAVGAVIAGAALPALAVVGWARRSAS
jgi:uncharacterized membrane protein